MNSSSLRTLHAAALNTVYQSNFFLHFGGMNTDEMQMVKQRATSWWDILA